MLDRQTESRCRGGKQEVDGWRKSEGQWVTEVKPANSSVKET